jgi:hypothetical protein
VADLPPSRRVTPRRAQRPTRSEPPPLPQSPPHSTSEGPLVESSKPGSTRGSSRRRHSRMKKRVSSQPPSPELLQPVCEQSWPRDQMVTTLCAVIARNEPHCFGTLKHREKKKPHGCSCSSTASLHYSLSFSSAAHELDHCRLILDWHMWPGVGDHFLFYSNRHNVVLLHSLRCLYEAEKARLQPVGLDRHNAARRSMSS